MTALFTVTSMLLIISIFFDVEIPLGGILFFVWLSSAFLKYQKANKKLKQAGVKAVYMGIIIGFWFLFAGLCLVYDRIFLWGSLLFLAGCFMIFPVRDTKEGITEKRAGIYWERIYVNAFYAVFVPVGIFMLLTTLKSLAHKKVNL